MVDVARKPHRSLLERGFMGTRRELSVDRSPQNYAGWHYAGQRPTTPSLSLSLGILSSPLVVGFVHSRPLAPRFSAERNSISRLARSQRLAPLTNNATLCAPGVLPYCSRVTKYRSQPFHHHPFAPTPLCAAARCVVTALDTPRGLMEIEGRAECFSSVDRCPRTIGDETTLEDPRVENVRTG